MFGNMINLTNNRRCDRMNKEYYVCCPDCGKKLFRVTDDSKYTSIFIWCKSCKKEYEFSKREPQSHCS